MKTHKDLDVWKQSIELVAHVYEITGSYPSNELYGITSQIRRASVSIPTNIAEGAARIHRKELLHFVTISLGSAAEIETLLIISSRLRYLAEEVYQLLILELENIIRMLVAMKKSLED